MSVHNNRWFGPQYARLIASASDKKQPRGRRLHLPICFPLVKGSLWMCRLPFWFSHQQKNVFTPLELLNHCIILSVDFWNVRALCLLLCSAFRVGNRREIRNGILDTSSIKGWFKLNRPFLFILTLYWYIGYVINRAGRQAGGVNDVTAL